MSTGGNNAASRPSHTTAKFRFVCAHFDFMPSMPEELHLEVGDVVKVVGSISDFWLQGVKLHNQESGQFPKDFVEDLIVPKYFFGETLLFALDTFYPEADGDLPFDKGNVVILERKINNEWGMGRCASLRGMFPLNYTGRLLPLAITSLVNEQQNSDDSAKVEKQSITRTNGLGLAKATTKLTAQLYGGLSFDVGDEISIIEVLDDGTWFKGRLGNNVGTFPADFVELLAPLKGRKTTQMRNLTNASWKGDKLDSAHDNANSNDESYDSGMDVCDKNLVKKAADKADLKPGVTRQCHQQLEKDVQPNNIAGATIKSSSTVAENCSRKEIPSAVTAMHKYTGNTEQELSFEKGTEILIFQEVDEHWLLGKVGSAEGYIARAYVSAPVGGCKADNSSVSKTAEKPDRTELQKTESVNSIGNSLIKKHHVYTPPKTENKGSRHYHIKSTRTCMKRAQAIYDYHARNKFDLTVSTGDTVWVIRSVDENWVEVKNETGQKGIIPTCYIQYAFDEELSMPNSSVQKGEGQNSNDCSDDFDGAQNDEILHREITNSSIEHRFEQSLRNPMPVLHEDAASNDSRSDKVLKDLYATQLAAFSPKLFASQKPKSLPKDAPTESSNRQQFLQKSISVDSAIRHNPSVSIYRSNSNPQSRRTITAKDARLHLRAWHQARRMSSPTGSHTPPNERSVTPPHESNEQIQVQTPKKLGFNRAASRSASMREKRSRRRHEDAASRAGSFIKIKSDSDLSVDAVMGRARLRAATSGENGRPTKSTRHPRSEQRDATQKTWYIDSASTTSTGSSSSYGDSRASHSVQSDISGSDVSSATSRKSASSARRSAPPVPPHAPSLPEHCQNAPDPDSTWSPPVPTRKQSLQHESRRSVDVSSLPPEVSRGPDSAAGLVLSPSAPELPPRIYPTASPQKKVPPMRPAHPPRSRSPNTRTISGGAQERVRNVASREMKAKIEKVRQEIEEYSRMKRGLENLYRGTLNGKERKDIMENIQFVKANIKRLQNEFHSLIEGQEDHIYESIEPHLRARPAMNGNGTSENLSVPPPLPPPLESPASVRKKRQEKRLLVASELVNTERDFSVDVAVTVEDIMNELIDRQIPQTTITTLFANIIQVEDFSKRLLAELEEALQNETSAQPDFQGATIGQVFIDNNPEMKDVYMPYCRNHDDAMILIEKLNEDPDFMQAVQTCLENIRNKVNVFDLGSFLIKPVQRFLKYPLLIEELIKLTDASTPTNPSDQDKLVLAHKLMQSLAKDINEDKRTKDLVRKYKDASSEGLSEKLGKLSMKSIKKKSSRISKKLGLATGISTREMKDLHFDEVEQRFKAMERAAKLFIQNVTAYCNKCHDVLGAESVVAQAMVNMVFDCDHSHPVALYQTMAEKMVGPLYRQFHDQVQLQVIPPVQSLVTNFKSPQAIIDKRLDKLIDFERSLKHSDSKDKIEAARHDYEALNKSLLDELPRLCDLGLKLLTSCTAIFAKFHRDFESKLLTELLPLLVVIQSTDDGEPKIPSNMETYDRFRPVYAEAISTISRLQVVPAAFGALYGSQKGSAESQRKFRTGPPRRHSESNSSVPKQPPADREALRKKYAPRQLHVADKDHAASQPADLSCCEGDLVAVLKQRDPMGSGQKWFVDRGGAGLGLSTGFLPSAILRPYDQARDEPLPTGMGSPQPHRGSPVPLPRRRSPTPSSRSASSADSGSASGASKPPLSPFALRESLKRGTLPPKEDGSPAQLTDPEILEALAMEDEIFDDSDYGEYSNEGTSPNSSKQHFRAEYDFTARSDLELTVRGGNIVKLIMAHDTDGNCEWWLVSNADGKQGYVPSNYLTKAEYL